MCAQEIRQTGGRGLCDRQLWMGSPECRSQGPDECRIVEKDGTERRLWQRRSALQKPHPGKQKQRGTQKGTSVHNIPLANDREKRLLSNLVHSRRPGGEVIRDHRKDEPFT
jgi:hypothetical protein